MTDVHVILTGIVSLIPDPATNAWKIRLHDERSTPMHMMDHYPSILVDRADLASPPSPDCSKTLPSGTVLYAWKLSNGDINIKSTFNSPAITLTPPPLLLSIEKGCTAAGGGPQCPITKPFPKVEMKAAFGSLTATELEDDMWQWNTLPADWIAQEVCWNFMIDGTELEIDLPYNVTTLTLKIVAPPNGNIELRLQNTLDTDIFPTKPPIPKPSPNRHTDLYFDESSAPPSPLPVLQSQTGGNKPVLPHHAPHRLTDSNIGTEGLRVNCPPALWNG